MVVYVDLATNPHGIIALSVIWVMTALSGLFLSLRLYSKVSRRRRMWWDDYLIVVSWVWSSRGAEMLSNQPRPRI